MRTRMKPAMNERVAANRIEELVRSVGLWVPSEVEKNGAIVLRIFDSMVIGDQKWEPMEVRVEAGVYTDAFVEKTWGKIREHFKGVLQGT